VHANNTNRASLSIVSHGIGVLQVSAALDKLATRERFLNSQCEHLTAEYRDAKEHLSQLQMQFNQKQDAAAELDNELTNVVKV